MDNIFVESQFVKTAITSLKRIPQDRQILIVGDTVMEDGHNIQAGSTVTLVLRLRTFDPIEETPVSQTGYIAGQSPLYGIVG
ncbi:uncharacterized [Tachysurus ichikawai]